MFLGNTAPSFTPSRSAALRLACRKSSMPCSAMMRAASWASARRRSSARCEYLLAIYLEERFVAIVQRILFVLPFVGFRLGQAAIDELFHDGVRIIGTRQQSRVGRNAHGHDAVRHRNLVPGNARERLVHEEYPRRQGGARALFELAQRTVL